MLIYTVFCSLSCPIGQGYGIMRAGLGVFGGHLDIDEDKNPKKIELYPFIIGY